MSVSVRSDVDEAFIGAATPFVQAVQHAYGEVSPNELCRPPKPVVPVLLRDPEAPTEDELEQLAQSYFGPDGVRGASKSMR